MASDSAPFRSSDSNINKSHELISFYFVQQTLPTGTLLEFRRMNKQEIDRMPRPMNNALYEDDPLTVFFNAISWCGSSSEASIDWYSERDTIVTV